MTGLGVRIRVYCDSADRAKHQPLTTAIVQLLWKAHAAGVTVIHGQEGFGASRLMHSVRLVDLGSNHPVVIEWIDARERIDEIWPQLEPLVRNVVVTTEDVHLLVAPHHGLRQISHRSTVEGVMSTDVTTVDAATPLPDVVQLMTERGHRFVPVLDEGRLVGVITNGDLVDRGGLTLRVELRRALGSEAPTPQGGGHRRRRHDASPRHDPNRRTPRRGRPPDDRPPHQAAPGR